MPRRDQTLRAELGIRQQVLTPAELAELEPALPTIEGRAVLFPDAIHVIDPAALVRGLQRKAQLQGATFHRVEVTPLEVQPDGRILLRGPDTSVRAGTAVIAAAFFC
jgi:glycine/D-amino acid oxidase-like deaminating enzyme